MPETCAGAWSSWSSTNLPAKDKLPLVKRLLALAPLVLLALTGCQPRIKGLESFNSATTPIPGPAGWSGDIYSYGGLAYASGGTRARTLYGRGADPQGRPFPGYDQPAKGTGLQPGEVPPSQVPWWAQQNAPAWQPAPGTENGRGTRVPN